MDFLGVVGWARCAALLNKELAAMLPRDIVLSVGDFTATSSTYSKVSSKFRQAC